MKFTKLGNEPKVNTVRCYDGTAHHYVQLGLPETDAMRKIVSIYCTQCGTVQTATLENIESLVPTS